VKPADAALARLASPASLDRLRLVWDGPFPAALQDAEFRLVDVNAAFERFTGRARDTLVGLDPVALLPEDERMFGLAWRAAARDGANEGTLHESRLIGADGRERWFRAALHRLDGARGAPLYLMLLQDATAEHLARRRAERSERELDHWFDLNPAGMALYDGTGLLVRSNPAFETLVGHAPVLLADAAPALQELLAWQHGAPHPALVPEGQPLETRGVVALPDGRRQRLRAVVRAFDTADGLRVMAAVEDRAHEDERELSQLEIGALMNTAGVGVATWEPTQGWTRSRQPRARKGAGGAAMQAISRELVEPASLPEYERLQQALKAGERAEVRYAVRHPELGRRWLLTRVEPGQLAGGRRAASVVTLDVTEQQLAHDERQNAREQLELFAERTRAVLDSVLVGIVTVGEHGIEWMNRSARRMFGGDLADFIGQPIATVATPEPDHPLRRTHYLHALAEGHAEAFECRLQARDGRTYWVVGNAVVTGRGEGAPPQLTFALLDIERRRQAEVRIAQAQASLARIIETAPLAIGLLDAASLRVLQLNQMAATFAGRSMDDILGRTPHDLFDGDVAGPLADDLRAAVAGAGITRREIERDGRVWDIRCSPLAAAASDAPAQILLVASDVTEQRTADRARYDAAIAQRERLVQEVHHRIKNNLQGVAGLMQQIAQRRPEVAPVIAEAVGQVQAIAQVYGLQVGSTGPLRVKSVVDAIAASVQRQFGRPIALDVQGAPHRWALPEAESIPIALTVNELLTNAHKHGAGGEVRCTLVCGDADVRIRIENAGRLPDGFDLARVPGGVSGLGLVRALLPRRSAALTLAQSGPDVVASVTLAPPGVQLLAPL
jgi:PAS domain S-box-containing protein